jgi:tetrapyrrole methylase family protein/MazG family protein
MVGTRKAGFEDLVEIMMTLRGPNGCPWDREQTHASLKRHLIEEAYEVVEAIDGGDAKHLEEELGDLLLQIVFHAQIAAENGDFDISDVLEVIVNKLLGRHPHIFGDKEAETPEDVMVHWDEAKRKEGKSKILGGVPRSLPALLYAYKVQKKAARVGFDWEEKAHVMDKLLEEVEEFKEVCLEGQGQERSEEEIGDILFTIVNVARHNGVDPESALRKTIKKFQHRFEYVEQQAEIKQIPLTDMPLEEKEILWQEAKKMEDEGG